MKRTVEGTTAPTTSSSSSSSSTSSSSSDTNTILEKKARLENEECAHRMLRYGTCFGCGKVVPLDGYIEQSHGVYVREEAAEEVAESLLRARKLSLVLDLDNTLIRCEAHPISEELLERLEGRAAYVASDGTSINLLQMDDRPGAAVHRVVLRPHVNEFLNGVSGLYAISMNTMGVQPYARSIVRMFDEKAQRLFRRGNIISRDVRGSADPKKPAKGLSPRTGGARVTMIVDDNVSAWVKPFDLSVIEIPPFLPFGPEHNETLDPPSQRAMEDTELLNVKSILERIHGEFFRAYDKMGEKLCPGVGVIASDLRGRTLRGCRIVFSGLIPKNARPENSPLWIKAQKFGACCFRELDPTTTHLVTSSPGTEKAVAAILAETVHVVPLEWLEKSFNRWERLPEADFAFPGVPPPTGKPESPKEDDDDDDFDDDDDDDE